MKKTIFNIIAILSLVFVTSVWAGSKEKGEKCIGDHECAFNLTCSSNVCVKKKAFDFGSSGKSGKNCNIDADCIGSGKCVEGTFGKKVCSGN